jgi:hypothetical protein
MPESERATAIHASGKKIGKNDRQIVPPISLSSQVAKNTYRSMLIV